MHPHPIGLAHALEERRPESAVAEGALATARPIDRNDLAALYAECAAALDDGEYERWPTFFTEDCSYVVTTKENLDRGWSIALLSCESRGMLLDRVFAVQKTLFYMPRVQRRIVSGARLVGAGDGGAHARASVAVFETLVGEHTTLFAAGRSLDVVRYEGDALKFAKRTCVLDSSLVPNSLPFPI